MLDCTYSLNDSLGICNQKHIYLLHVQLYQWSEILTKHSSL